MFIGYFGCSLDSVHTMSFLVPHYKNAEANEESHHQQYSYNPSDNDSVQIHGKSP